MQRNIINTKDGSHTIQIPDMKVTYHSIHGAISESLHVFIEAGFNYWHTTHATSPCSILEMGFGTGLNALLTLQQVQSNQLPVVYESLEAYPLNATEVQGLNYTEQLQRPDLKDTFQLLHTSEWNIPVKVHPYFTLIKHYNKLQTFETSQLFDIIYYDAFAPSGQPELWTAAIFRQLLHLLHEDGLLVTYCAKGDVRRAMQAAGLLVAKLPGPPGKREMLRATKK